MKRKTGKQVRGEEMKVLVIPPNQKDDIKLVDVTDQEGLDQIKDLQRLIGGYIEQIVTTRLTMRRNVALIDEDGRVKGRELNLRATWRTAYPVPLVGTVVLVGLDNTGKKWEDYHD